MPTYEYHCAGCRKNFDLFQSMTEAPIKKCPKCRKAVTRLFGTGAGIVFKGSGFYHTDYKRGPEPASAAASPKTEPSAKPKG